MDQPNIIHIDIQGGNLAIDDIQRYVIHTTQASINAILTHGHQYIVICGPGFAHVFMSAEQYQSMHDWEAEEARLRATISRLRRRERRHKRDEETDERSGPQTF